MRDRGPRVYWTRLASLSTDSLSMDEYDALRRFATRRNARLVMLEQRAGEPPHAVFRRDFDSDREAEAFAELVWACCRSDSRDMERVHTLVGEHVRSLAVVSRGEVMDVGVFARGLGPRLP